MQLRVNFIIFVQAKTHETRNFMPIEELILQQTALLPEELKRAVLLYISFLVQQYQNQAVIIENTVIEESKTRGMFGILKGKMWIVDDFDAPLEEEFADYM